MAKRSDPSPPPTVPTNPVHLARIGAAHGIRGECRVKPFTEDPEAVGDYGPLFSEDGTTRLTVVTCRTVKNGMLVVRFEELSDRNAAEALNGLDLYVDREALGEPEEDGEFLVADLIGLDVVDRDGAGIGRITAVPDFGAGDLLDIELSSGGSAYLPLTEAFVPEIDLEQARVVINPPDGWAG